MFGCECSSPTLHGASFKDLKCLIDYKHTVTIMCEVGRSGTMFYLENDFAVCFRMNNTQMWTYCSGDWWPRARLLLSWFHYHLGWSFHLCRHLVVVS